MCGIVGAVWSDMAGRVPEGAVARMMGVLRHRGPDDEGIYRRELATDASGAPIPGVALGHRRLSIIDLAQGQQPLANEDGSIWVICNGEIYNYRSLRRRLEGAGHVFRTQSDTEVLVHLYEDEGPACFQHCNGMFAVAIWDGRRRQLVLARDRLGKKPLVYHHNHRQLLFASELKGLLQLPEVPRDLDPNALDEYLTYQYVPHPRTIFRGIRKLPPAHYATWRDGELRLAPYWSPSLHQQPPQPLRECVEQVQGLFRSAVELRMQSEVPLGAFLSGGVDSSLVVAQMKRLTDARIKTYSIGFRQAEYDETRYARQVAQHLGTDHHEYQVSPDCIEMLPRLIWHFDEPMADSSAIPTWYVAQWARQHVKVALTGDGGDELFAGYARYAAVAWGDRIDRLPAVLRRALSASCWQRLPASARQRSWIRQAKRFAEHLRLPPSRRYLEWVSIFKETQRATLYREDFLESLEDSDPSRFLDTNWERAAGRDSVTQASLTDLFTYLPCDLMTKVDISSMAHSLECRQPFLDYRLVECAVGLPVEWKFRHGRGKWLLRQAFADWLPADIWQRPKMGFGVPLDAWFRGEFGVFTRETLLASSAHISRYFYPHVVARWVEEHQRSIYDHSARLWALIVLELWMQRWLKPHSSSEYSG